MVITIILLVNNYLGTLTKRDYVKWNILESKFVYVYLWQPIEF